MRYWLGILMAAIVLTLAFPAFSQEVAPVTLLFRISNPAASGGAIVIKCGREIKKIGVALPGMVDIHLEAVDLSCVGDPEAELAIIFRDGKYAIWKLFTFEPRRRVSMTVVAGVRDGS